MPSDNDVGPRTGLAEVQQGGGKRDGGGRPAAGGGAVHDDAEPLLRAGLELNRQAAAVEPDQAAGGVNVQAEAVRTDSHE